MTSENRLNNILLKPRYLRILSILSILFFKSNLFYLISFIDEFKIEEITFTALICQRFKFID